MKTQILRLETQDDTASIRDKIAWAKAGRILLAFPKRRSPRLNKLDFILIQRTATRAGAQLAITTRDPEIIQAADILDIPVFHSIQAAQRSPWLVVNRKRRVFRPPDADRPEWIELRNTISREPKKPIPKALQLFLFILGLAAFLLLVLLFVPGAVIEVSPARESQSIDMTVFPQVGLSSVLPGGQIPAAEVRTTVSGQMEAIATGKIIVPSTPARIALLISNLTGEAVDIPAGSVFSASEQESVRFLTNTGVTLPAGVGQTVEVAAEAELPGSSGNLPAGAINAVEGPLGLQIAVTNPEPAAGGEDRTGRSASETDYSQLYDTLITSMTDTAVINLQAQYGKDLMILSESMKIDNVVEVTRQPPVDSPSDRVNLSLTVDFSGLAVSTADLAAVAASSMDTSLPEDTSVDPGSYTFKSLSAPLNLADGRMSWEIQAARQLVQDVKVKGLALSVKGLPIAEVRQRVQHDLGLEQPPKISVSPAWWPRLPLIPFRIEVIGQ